MSEKFASSALDDADDAIVGLLEVDGRLTHREIAERIGLSRSAAAARVQRLLDEGHVAVRGVAHPAVLGRDALAHVALVVRGSAVEVARAAADREDTTFVSLVTGRHSVVVEVRTAGVVQTEAAVAELRDLAGVDGVDTLVYTEVVRDVAGPVGAVTVEVDDVDRALLRVLQDDGRASYVRLGEEVGLSAAGARRRVLRLVEGQAVRVGAVVRHTGRGRRTATGVGIRLTGDARELLDRVVGLPSLIFAARSLGRYDAVLTVSAGTSAQLVEVLDDLRALPGVRDVETWGHLEFVKESYASVRL
ncbi:Lrp/AsnC family transcriptional regulator [Nocardioides sp. YIM 152588]|uniref:Lrp/AsnC family transcriptional regulator n=1 Tax=Nocardioides sp. YIM 152588 TaxID=3158259 RepID=UPI0032E51E2D